MRGAHFAVVSMNFGPALVGRFALAGAFAALGALSNAACARADIANQSRPESPASNARPAFDIEAYDVDGNTVLDQETIESAVYPFLGPGRSKEDVFAARDALQKAYQTRGFQSVVVDVPQQDARAGVIRLHVIEAPVGRLRVVGSNYYSLDRIKEQAPSIQEGKVPDFNQAQKEVAELNRLPDRRVTPLIKPGKIPGTVDIDLKVNDTLPVHASVEVNNDHAQNTTPIRTAATISYANLWQMGHTLSLTALLAPKNFDDAQVYSGSYVAPIWGTPWSILLYGYDSNSSVITLGGTDVLGKGYAMGLRGIYQLPSWGEVGQSINFGLDYKHFLENLALGTSSTGAIIDYVPLVTTYTLQAAQDLSTATLGLALTLGLRGLGSSQEAFFNKRASARANFVHVNVDADITQDFGDVGQIALHMTEQLADGPLVSSEEFSAGGLTSVRGYLQSEALGDDGVFTSMEVRSPSIAPWFDSIVDQPIFEEWRFYGFTDGAIAWVLDALPGQQSKFKLGSFGLGSRLHAFGHLSTDLIVGIPMRDATVTKAWRPYFQFSVKTEL
jgi:hemolysin activation/secretion protein